MNEKERLSQSYIPMTEAGFLILSALLEENHGYGIMQKVFAATGGRVNLGAGTVYTILYKMEKDGLIKFTEESERRKLYVILPLGKEILLEEIMRLRQLGHIAAQIEPLLIV